jgi:hypothetical protein
MSLSSLITEGEDLILNQGKNIFQPLISGGSVVQNTGYITSGIDYALSKVKAKNWRFDLGYSFEVEGDRSNQFAKFNLQINPQDLQQAENFAITITPCQTGVVVEHQGFVMKPLTISGTTAMRPSDTSRTGYEEFLNLRNYFRSYSECKKYPEYKDLRLIFRNKKDNEHWYVEPTGPGVALRRVADRPFLYDFTISLTIIGKTTEYPKKTGLYGQILDDINFVEDLIDEVSDRIEDAAVVIRGSFDLLRRVNRQIAITLTNPLDKVSETLKAMKFAKTTVSALPSSFYQELKRSATDVRDNFIDLIGKGDSRYNTTFGRTPCTVSKSFVFSDVKTLESVNEVVICMDKMLSSGIAFSPDAGSGNLTGTSTSLTDAMTINSQTVQNSRTASNVSLTKAFKGALDFEMPQSVKESTIQYGDTIERLAYREMGDVANWHQIVILNNIDPPYFSETPIAGKNTLKSGDKILIPFKGTVPDINSILKKGSSKISESLSVFERNLGVDLQLTSDNDLSVNQSAQDLDLFAGLNNIAQALRIKLGLERDDLMYHPEIGVDMQVGQKTIYTAEEIIDQIESCLLQDQRLQSVDSIQIERDSSTVKLFLKVSLKRFNKVVPLQLVLRG